MQTLQRGVIDLVKACLIQEKAHIGSDFDWAAAYHIGCSHNIVPMLNYGIIQSNSQLPTELRLRFRMDTLKSVVVDQKQLYEVKQIERKFQEHAIDYLPLKGMILKQRYPHTEVRTMSDADILIREEQYEKIRSVMQELGFTEILESNHELVLEKAGCLYLELHKRLIPSYNKDYYAYYSDGWKLTHKVDGSRCEMRGEDEFIYLFTHYAKHYRDGGVGIRQVADLFVYMRTSPGLDFQYIEVELDKLGLLDFYCNTRETLRVWFEDGENSAMTDFITDTIFSSGAFGTNEKHVLSSGVKDAVCVNPKHVQWQRRIKLIFPPAVVMMSVYPILKKCKIMLPLVWVHRWLWVLLYRRENIRRNYENVKLLTAEKIIKHQAELNYVGLKFNFGEEK